MKKLISIIITLVYFTLSGQSNIESSIIFPLQGQHVHSSSIVQLPNGDLLT